MAALKGVIPAIVGAANAAAGGFKVERSLRFNSGDSAYLNRTPSSAGNRKTFTWSGWVKRTALGADKFIFSAGSDASNMHYLRFKSNNTLEATEKIGDSVQSSLVTSAAYRDPSAWYHIVYIYDSTQSTAADRMSLYVNGAKVTEFGTSTYPSQNHDSYINSTSNHFINARPNPAGYSDAYLAEIHFVDGQALAPTDFGEYDDNNNWNPKDTSGLTFGTNGFHLKFADNSSASALGTDTSGNGNNWTVNNISVAAGSDNDSLIDTPTNYEAGSGNNGGNYATYNPLNLHNTADTVSEGNLKLTSSGSGSSHMGRGTIAMKSGKWYFEVTWVDTQHNFVGIVGQNDTGYNNSYVYLSNAKKSNTNGSSEGSSYGATWGDGDIIGCAFDADNGTLVFYKNGVSQGTAFTGIATDGSAGTYSPYPLGYVAITGNWNYNDCTSHINFGQRPFAISSVPAGFKALCTQNLADPTIADGSTAMDVKLWTGDGSSTRTISNYSFSPDFVWIKNRTTAGWQHVLYDQIRGGGTGSVTKSLSSDSTRSEASGNDTNHGYLSGFTSDGYNLVKGSQATGDYVNFNSWAYVGWAWDAGTVANPVGDTWQGSATKYIGVKFSSASGGTISFGQTTGSTTVEVWSSSDNSNWTQQGGTLTLADGHTLTFTDQYVYIRNTSNATFTDWFAAATDDADGHYSSATYPSGASWSGPTYTDYDWRDTGGVINEDGSIPSVVRVNTSAGCSVVSYNGTGSNGTVGHGLNAAPHMYIVKNRSNTYEWGVYHTSIGAGAAQVLNATNNNSVSGTWWNSTVPTSSVFSIGTYGAVNQNTSKFIAYCFTPVVGFSAFGMYEGNSSDNGPFLFTGFRVKWVMIKCTNAAGQEWVMLDAARSSFNVADDALYANNTDAEATGSTRKADFLSNGFKLRDGSSGATNLSGRTYLYAAFAEHPFKTSRAR